MIEGCFFLTQKSKNINISVLPWGNQRQAVLDLCPGPAPLSISVSSGSIPKPFGVALVPTWKKNFFVSEISADPQKRPYGVKGASSRVKNDPNFLMKIYLKFIIS